MMKKPWTVAVCIDGVAAAVLFFLMWMFNSSDTHGVAAMTAVGGFAVTFVLFQLALAVLITLLTVAAVKWFKNRKK